MMIFTGCTKENPDNKPDDKSTIPATITDMDGNTYKTVKIGSQVWMRENLRTTKYNDGSSIPLIVDSVIWTNRTHPAYCWYSNDIANKIPYGALYNWFAIDSGKICPVGWRVPSNDDWNKLITSAGGSVHGGDQLKEQGIIHWGSLNSTATNTSGFTALPAGYRHGDDGTFLNKGNYGVWWSSNDYGLKQFGWATSLYSQFSSIEVNFYRSNYGYSVRCIME